MEKDRFEPPCGGQIVRGIIRTMRTNLGTAIPVRFSRNPKGDIGWIVAYVLPSTGAVYAGGGAMSGVIAPDGTYSLWTNSYEFDELYYHEICELTPEHEALLELAVQYSSTHDDFPLRVLGEGIAKH